MTKPLKKAVVASFFLFIFVGTTADLYLKTQETKQEIIQLENVAQETIFFYRDDCSACQKLFNRVYLRGVLKGDQVNVNLNQEKNRRYISLYALDEVPTLIQNQQRYEGTTAINQLLASEALFSEEVDE